MTQRPLLYSLAFFFLLSFNSGKKTKYIDSANMDLSVRPGDDFYQYANGTWLRNNPVPGSKTRWGSWDELRESNSKRILSLLETVAAHVPSNPKQQMVADFYTSGMDSSTLEHLDYQPIKADLARITTLNGTAAILREVAYERRHGVANPLFGLNIIPDPKNVTRYIPQISQGGISLPDREYYLKDDNFSKTIRNAYAAHITRMFSLIGYSADQATAASDAVIRIETALAAAHMARVEMRDPYKTYNLFAWKELPAATPAINWKDLAADLQVTDSDSLVVANPYFLRSVSLLLEAVPLHDWKDYLRWNVLRTAAPALSARFVEESFAFSHVLSGQREQTPRWQRIGALIDVNLSDLLGQLYIEKYFSSEAKQRMQALVDNLQQTFSTRIEQLDWMSDQTKRQALEKLKAFGKKIGYPEKWRNYSTITINKDDLIGHIRSCKIWDYQNMIARLGKPVDQTLWVVTPPTVNAFYNASNNDITFPAGILQFPFYDVDADDPVNYGGIGAVIGHEMTHAFDDEGRQFAADGNMKDWWTAADADQFKSKAWKVVDQYNGFVVLDTLHINGRLTLGENLADLGGLSVAYEALTQTKSFKEGKKIDGLTPGQRFFLSWAQIWRQNALPETQAQLILTDTHSPGRFRTNGPMMNIDAWYDAFNIQIGDKMYKAPDKRTHVW